MLAVLRCFGARGYKRDVTLTRRDIGIETGLPDRVVRRCIAAAVQDGYPILSDRKKGGYRWSLNREEIKAEIALLRSHAARILERASALERHLAANQGRLFG